MTYRVAEVWCWLPVELDEVFDRFRSEFPVDDFIHDAENVWEWFDGRTTDDALGFNITRQWEMDSIPDVPVRISLAVFDSALSTNDIGRRLAIVMRTAVFSGEVN